MKNLGVTLILMMGLVSPLFGQLTIGVKLEQEQFLPGEDLRVAVSITNRSGRTLQLGAEEDWLSISVEARNGAVVAKNQDPPVVGSFLLESSKVATKRLNLAPYFELDRPGTYRVIATVKVKEWDRQLASVPRSFDIIQGSRLWEQDFGVPSSSTNGIPEMRKYMLQQANYLRGPLQLYLRLTDATGIRVIRVMPLGQLLSFSRVDRQIDGLSNLHVLFNDQPESYLYTVINPDGNIVDRQVYDYGDTRPRLHVDESGKISVVGGARRISVTNVTEPERKAPEGAPKAKP